MRDISARELKGHNILAVERFWDNHFHCTCNLMTS